MPNRSSYLDIDSENRLVITEVLKGAERYPSAEKGGGRAKASYEGAVIEVGGKKRVRKIALDGVWSLTPEHDLRFRVSGAESAFYGKTIILRGNIERVNGTALTFRVRQCDTVSGLRTSTIELKGRWRADSNNRITFNAARSRGKYNVLRFQGAWRVNRNNELIYKYSRTALRTKVREERTLVFKGFWELGKGRVVYNIEGSDESFFSIKVALRSRSLRASAGAIKYQVGIKYYRKGSYRRLRQTVTIFGTWKLGVDLAVGFEVKYSGGKRRLTTFTVEKLIGEAGSVSVSLKSEKGEPLGFEVTFSRAFKTDAELFLTLARHAAESRVTGGLRVRF